MNAKASKLKTTRDLNNGGWWQRICRQVSDQVTWEDEYKRKRLLKWMVILAMLSLYLTLWVPISGEEGNYTINAMEMYQSGQWWNNTIMGEFYPRPPLMKIMVMLVSQVIGFKHVLIASRLVSATATVGTAWVTFFLTRGLTKKSTLAWFVTAIYLSGDLLMRRGWLAYADPVFSFFVMASMASLWWSLEKKSNLWLLLGCVCVFLAFISKELRAFTFYGSLGLMLLILHPNRWFLLRPWSWVFHVLLLFSPWLWSHYTEPYLGTMWQQMLSTTDIPMSAYLFNVFWYSPFMLVVRLAPVSVIVLWALKSRWREWGKWMRCQPFYNIFLIAVFTTILNWVPCWLSKGHAPYARYYAPVYPFFAMSMGLIIWAVGRPFQRVALWSLLVLLVAKWLLAPWLHTFMRNEFHHNHFLISVARQVVNLSEGYKIYMGGGHYDEHIAHYINVSRWPAPTIKRVTTAHEKTYYVVTTGVRKGDDVIKFWPWSHNKSGYYLVCRGVDCPRKSAK